MRVLFVLLAIVCLAAAFQNTPVGDWVALDTHGEPPSARDFMLSAVFADSIYSFFGFFENLDPYTFGTVPQVFYNDVFQFNLLTQTWSQLTVHEDPHHGLPTPRAFGFGGLQGVEFITGYGISYTAEFTDITTFNDMWAFNIFTNSWRQIPAPSGPAPSARAEVTAHLYQGKIYLFGGVNADFVTLDDMWVYDIASNTWTELSPALEPTGRYGTISALDAVAGRIYMYSGEASVFSATGVSFPYAGPDVFYYLDLHTDTWVLINPARDLPQRNNGNGAIFTNHKFFVFGGDIGGGPDCNTIVFNQNNVNQTWVYDADTTLWTQLCPATAPPNLKRATSVQVGDTWYLYGGFAYNDATCGPQIFNLDVWAYRIGWGNLRELFPCPGQ